MKIINCRHELCSYSEYRDIVFIQLEVGPKVESIMVHIEDEGSDGWYFYHGEEYTASSDSGSWNEEMPEGLSILPEKLMEVFMEMDERNIKSWPDSLIGTVV